MGKGPSFHQRGLGGPREQKHRQREQIRVASRHIHPGEDLWAFDAAKARMTPEEREFAEAVRNAHEAVSAGIYDD